jgi:regulator of replication initiation timing
MTRKQRSNLQKAQSKRLGGGINLRKRPRDSPSPEPVPLARFLEWQEEALIQRNKKEKFKKAKYNEVKKVNRAVASMQDLAALVTELHNEIEELRNQLSCALTGLDLAQNTILSLVDENATLKRAKEASRKALSRLLAKQTLAVDRAVAKAKTQFMKSKGVILQPIRDAVMALISDGVPESKLCNIFHAVARSFGIEVPDSISQRSIGRIAHEAFATCCIQLGDELSQAKSKSEKFG